MFGALRSLHQTYVVELMQSSDAAADETRGEAHREFVVVVLTVLGVLIFIEHFGNSGRLSYWQDLFRLVGWDEGAESIRSTLYSGPHASIARKVFWAGARVLAYIVLPFTVVKLLLPGASIRELFGLRGRMPAKHLKLYATMLAVIAPFVVAASYTPAFQRKYPFYRPGPDESLWPWFLLWELLYAAQFLGLEIFYRGFVVHGLKRRVGYASIYFMMVPYMMIHFGKPLPECIGSIVAGFALGTMSLATGSIWGGVALHIIVAWSMDALALWHAS